MILEQVSNFQEFLDLTDGKSALLLVKEEGCRYCEQAHKMITEKTMKEITDLKFLTLQVESDPNLSSHLILTGVPAIVLKNASGQLLVKIGLCKEQELIAFIRKLVFVN